ncbi:MAG: right-handed parallel beta-helix repeat-containing protein [Fimbriimonadaceae bacterium]|nr:right-handed parallel beta-helix repeat-containing protein [Fimbriimonadaceae bacterium]
MPRCAAHVLLCLLCLPASAAVWHVAPNGADTQAGSAAAPFATIQRAAVAAQPGDTVQLAAGTYREVVTPPRDGAAGQPIRFEAAGHAVLTGSDPLSGTWRDAGNGLWELATTQRCRQLFCDGRPLPEARWPNVRSADPMEMPRATTAEGTNYTTLVDPNLPAGDWNGALVLLWPGSRWDNFTRRVTQYQPGQSFVFDQTLEKPRKDPYHTFDPYKPVAGNPYLLFGCRAALDAPGEWFDDAAAGRLYLRTPAGQPPATHRLEVRQRGVVLNLKGRQYLELRGLRIEGGALDLTDAQHCLLEDCHQRYPDAVREYPEGRVPPAVNLVSGRDNELRRCSIGNSATTGLRVQGEGNRLVDCVLFNLNYLGSSLSGVDYGRSVACSISRCSIGRTGRDTIGHHGSKKIRIEHCEIWQTNLLNNDSGAIYCWGTDGEGGVIAYNWIHDNLGDSTVGVYLDNFSRNFIVHHNLIWNSSGSGIRLNSDALGHVVANNTILRSREPFGTYCYSAYTPTMAGTRILNNLVDVKLKPSEPSYFVQGALGPELRANLVGAMDRQALPTAGSAAVDAGVSVPGVTAEFAGAAPDVGAYESGRPRWTAGATWQPPDAPQPQPADLSFAPLPPLSAATMITRGLRVWLDAAADSVVSGADGALTAWRDQAPGAAPRAVQGRGLRLVPAALNGRPVVRGDGQSCLPIGTLREELGAVAMFVVAAGPAAAGPSWQRICGAWVGDAGKKDWESPSWCLNRPGGATPAVFAPQLYQFQRPNGHSLRSVMVFGPGTGNTQYLAGDIAELLLYDRALSPSEADAISDYLLAKWGLQP